MREIKFRVWANTDEGLKMIFLDKTECDNGLWFGSRTWHIDDYENTIMQFTGLKDKNGKDIYEGDIVEHLTENKNWQPLDDESPLQVYTSSVVEYKGHGFWLSNEYFGWEGEGLANWGIIEIIGNIYENPELIKTLNV